MNLLLLLFALLSALTGASSGVRVAEPTAISQRVADVGPASVALARVAARPEQAITTIEQVVRSSVTAPQILISPLGTLLTNRRRE